MVFPGMMSRGGRSPQWRTAFSLALDTDTFQTDALNYRHSIPSSRLMVKNGKQMRFTLQGPNAGSVLILVTRVGLAASPGSINFSATPVPLFIKGINTNYTLGPGEIVVSNPITLTVPDGTDLIIAWMIQAGNNYFRYSATAGIPSGYKASIIDETHQLIAGGFSAITIFCHVTKIEVFK